MLYGGREVGRRFCEIRGLLNKGHIVKNFSARHFVAAAAVAILPLISSPCLAQKGKNNGGGGSSNNFFQKNNTWKPQTNNGWKPQTNNGWKPQTNNNSTNNGWKPQTNNGWKPQTNNGWKPQGNNNTTNNGGWKPQVKPQNTFVPQNTWKPQNGSSNNTVNKPLNSWKPQNNGNQNNGFNNLFSNGGKVNGGNNPNPNNGGKNQNPNWNPMAGGKKPGNNSGFNNGGFNNGGGKKPYPGWNPMAGGPNPSKPGYIKPGGWKPNGGNKPNNGVNNGLVAIGVINSVAGLVVPLVNGGGWNRPGWRPRPWRPYRPDYVVDPNYVDPNGGGFDPNGGGFDPNAGPIDPNQNGGEQMANVQPDPTQFSGGEIKISSGPDMPGDIGYVLNGTAYEMKPGYSQKFAEDRVWVIQFRNGDENSDVVEYTLTAGQYRFVVADGKLNLSSATPDAGAGPGPGPGPSPVDPNVQRPEAAPLQAPPQAGL